MIIKVIGYSASYESANELNLHRWDKPVIREAEIEQGDDIIDCLNKLRDICDASFKDAIKESSSIFLNNKEVFLVNDEIPIDTMILEMEACTELSKDPEKGLLSFELAIKNPEQKMVYEKMLLQLSNNKN